jgi:hypothetical protein
MLTVTRARAQHAAVQTDERNTQMLDLSFHPKRNEPMEGSLEACCDNRTSWVDLTLSSGDRTATLTIFFKDRADMLAFLETLTEDCQAALAKFDVFPDVKKTAEATCS